MLKSTRSPQANDDSGFTSGPSQDYCYTSNDFSLSPSQGRNTLALCEEDKILNNTIIRNIQEGMNYEVPGFAK